MKKYICYRATNITNGKKYIGVTGKTEIQRFAEHCGSARRGSNQRFHQAIRKYGADGFLIEVVATRDNETEILKVEKSTIISESSLLSQNGYNATTGGEYPHVDGEIRQRMSDAALARPGVTEETKARLSASLMGNRNKAGYVCTPEQNERNSQAQTGKIVSKETIEKRSGGNHYNAIKISICDVLFDTISDAANVLGVEWNTIKRRCESPKERFSHYSFVGDIR